MRSFLVEIHLLALGLLLLQIGCRSEQTPVVQQPSTSAAVKVRVLTAEMASQPRPYDLTGTVRPRQSVVITSKLSGTLLSVDVRMGDRVQNGEQLAKLDDRGPTIEVEQTQSVVEAATRGLDQAESGVLAAEAEARLAAATLQRMQQLFDKRSAYQQELDQASARQQAAQAGLAMARGRVEEARAHQRAALAASRGAQLRLSYAQIASPLDGTVVSRSVDPGAVVAPGMPLMQIEEGRDFRLEIAVPESLLSQMKPGTQVEVEVPAVALRATGRVVELEPGAEPGSRSAVAKVQLPDHAGLHGGLFGKATLQSGKQDVLIVPEQAIARQGQLALIHIYADGVARRRLITLGQKYAAGTEILSGLRAGEQVITSDLTQLQDGSPVEIAP